MPQTVIFLLKSVSMLAYFVMLVMGFVQRGWRSRMARLWGSFLLTYLLKDGVDLAFRAGRLQGFVESFQASWNFYAIFLGAVLLYWLAAAQYHALPTARYAVAGGGGVLALALALNLAPTAPQGTLWLGSWVFNLPRLIYWLMFAGWGVFSGLTLSLLAVNYRQAQFPTLRYRIFLWAYGFAILLLGNALSLLGRQDLFGGLVSLFGMLSIFLAVAWPRLPHFGLLIRRVLNGVIWLALQALAYGGGYLLVRLFFDGEAPSQHWIAAGLLALLAILVANPLLRSLQARIDRWFFGEEQDIKDVVREFSQSVSNVLDIDLLSKVVVDLARRVIGADSGMIFLVELEVNTEGERTYRVRPGGREQNVAFIGKLPVNSPLAQVWAHERRAVIVAELEMLSRYYELRATTRSWLARLEMDVFVPVHAREEWIGLIALGPKRTGASYYAEDINLLHMLADQTAVALQNARLVESLLRVNDEFRRAYAAMEEAHVKLQRIDRTKSDFINIASHELRTPLTILSGYAQILQDAPELQARRELADIIKGITAGAQRMHEIVESMLDVAAIDMQELSILAQPLKLEPLLRKVCQRYATVFRERQQRLRFDQRIAELPLVHGDPQALQKVFYQLVNNAVKYTPDGGEIFLNGQLIPPGDERFPQGGVEVTVRDTGIGIDPRYHELIFTKFYQIGDVDLHSSGKTKFKGGGPGLGLAIVRGVVQAHGGKVWVESPGYDEEKLPGSTFHVVLPLSD